MFKITMMLLTILCLNSCQSYERKITCNRIAAHQIKLHPACDISFKFNRCRCRCFDFNSWEEKPVNQCPDFFSAIDVAEKVMMKKTTGEKYEAVNYPLERCEGISGFFLNPDIAIDIRPNVKALHALKENLCD